VPAAIVLTLALEATTIADANADSAIPPVLDRRPEVQITPVPCVQAVIDPAALASFVDGVVSSYMAAGHIAGVTVAVANRNGPLLLHGYGVADEHPRREVDPDSTLFRIGSISKTFTYVAAMQLVAENKLELDAPVDRYLMPSLKTENPRYPPIRVWHLMTHTAGFEDAVLSAHMFYSDPRKVPQLEAYLARYRPNRVRAPAVHANYSNYSVELLGALVQRVSGEPFDQYIEKHILEPLRMQHTTFRELLPKDDPRAVFTNLAGDFATGFLYQNDGFDPQPPEYISDGAPAGAGSSDAADMAIWMRMLLNDGEIDGHQVLNAITFREMVTPTFRNATAVDAIAHGFFVGRYGSYSSLEHDGDTLWFHSNMVVLPQAGIGVFISTNTDTGSSLVAALPRLIFEKFLADARPALPPAPPKDFERSERLYEGTYISERRNETNAEKPLSTRTDVIAATADGYLVVNGGKGGRYLEESPDIFTEVHTGAHIQFLRSTRGHVVGMASANGHAVFDKAALSDSPRVAFAQLAVLLLVCLGTMVNAWGRRRSAMLGAPTPSGETFLPTRTLLSATCGWLLFLILMITAIAEMSAAGYQLLFDFPPPILMAAIVMGYVASLLTLVASWFLPRLWRLHSWSFWRRLRHSLILALMACSIVLLIEWKVLLAPWSL
jgi:CubicO group peptidase (beta-lactamase class C family)